MDIFLNEKCLFERMDVDTVLLFLSENIPVLHNSKIKVYTKLTELEQWLKDWESYFDVTSRNYCITLLRFLEECQDNTEQYYYHYIRHQDFTLLISENISTSSLAVASNKIMYGQNTAILNIPGQLYCERPHLPILKSSYNSKIKDNLINIPCFHNAKTILQYVLLEEKIKPFIEDKEDFEIFSKEYYSFIDSFDFINWEPKIFESKSKLKSTIAFPASSFEFIKSNISKWSITKENYHINVARYKDLGDVILKLHGYSKNIKLTNHYKFDIYEAGHGNKKLLISLDTENGAFEVIDYTGNHIGVYRYNGDYIKHYTSLIDIKSHSLKDIPKNMFIYN